MDEPTVRVFSTTPGGGNMASNPTFTIFGGTGDLTFRKLLPALYNRFASGTLPENHRVVIIGRREYTSAQYRTIARGWVKKFSRLPYKEEVFDRFSLLVDYYRMDFTDLRAYPELERCYEARSSGPHIFYLAVAPRFFSVIAEGLAGINQAREGKVILEKPFGETLEKAAALSRRLEEVFTPQNVYRIDHYLGKEMVRGIQTLRFANPIFTDAWDARHIECVRISALEDVGVETRGGYYDHTGALKDMVQNHLFQILSILAMERPADSSPEAMHDEQLRVLQALRMPGEDEMDSALVLGQYDGYREEPAVDVNSNTETYAALRLYVDTERWRGVPFYIETGKKMGRREMEAAIVFRSPSPEVEPNVLILKIQPEEGVYLRFNIKRPGNFEDMIPAKMDFCQNCILENRVNTPEAYERLLEACMKGERSWFSQWDQIEASWRFIDALRSRYGARKVYPYAPGTFGPAEAEEQLKMKKTG